jgi:plasmid stabilization system protein ParE
MTRKVTILPRAEGDAQSIFQWISERSPDGAHRWWIAFEEAVQRVAGDPHGYGLAPESELVAHKVRQFLFKTPRGRTYRGLFTVVGDEVRILRVRGPGQRPLESDEVE